MINPNMLVLPFDPERMRLELIEVIKVAPVEKFRKIYDATTGNIQQNYCPNCGNHFRQPDEFCSFCGAQREYLILHWA